MYGDINLVKLQVSLNKRYFTCLAITTLFMVFSALCTIVKAYTKLSRSLEMSCPLIVNDLDYATRLFLFIECTSSSYSPTSQR